MAISFPASPSVDQTFVVGSRVWVWKGTVWEINASVGAGGVSTNDIADASITTAKIADSAITASKIADGTIVAAEIANNAITTAKILDANVTQAKLGTTLSAVTVTTAANRDTAVASPFTGQMVFLTDTKKMQVWDGTSWLNITLAPPETPTSLSATALSTTSVSIAFTAGGANGSPITNYKYALSTDSGSTYGSFIALDPVDIATPITISGLTIGTTYYIKLKAVNDMGDSVASAPVSISTLAAPEAPTSLSAGSITYNSVAISFTPGAQGGSAITNYQYALSTNGGSTYGSFTALDPTDATSPVTITGLTADTAYYVKLKAVNTDGAGTESSVVSFTTSSVPALTVDYLVIAGGGGGGGCPQSIDGGGGAGGLRSTVTATGGGGSLESALSPTVSTNYTVTVAAGGGSSTSGGSNGSNSVFSTITATGGGRGGAYDFASGGNAQSGGSGGGGSGRQDGGGSGTANQGYAGGTGGANINATTGGGGGGAGAVGTIGQYNGTPTSVVAGVGGIGVAVAITGSSVYYAGGGGAGVQNSASTVGVGGNGGGGNGAKPSTNPTAGTVNTGAGGGGGGGNEVKAGGAGGSGVVILRYSSAYTITLGAGLTGTTATVSSNKVTTITAGSGNVSWT